MMPPAPAQAQAQVQTGALPMPIRNTKDSHRVGILADGPPFAGYLLLLIRGTRHTWEGVRTLLRDYSRGRRLRRKGFSAGKDGIDKGEDDPHDLGQSMLCNSQTELNEESEICSRIDFHRTPFLLI